MMDLGQRSHIPRGALISVVLLGVLPLLVVIGGGVMFDVSIKAIIEDTTVASGSPFWTGGLTQVGVLFWWSGATVALFAAGVIRGRPAFHRWTAYLVGIGLISGYLAIDDLFRLHETVYDNIQPLPQLVILAGTAVLVLLYFVAFRTTVLRTDPRLLIAAAVFFAVSLGIDAYADLGYILETRGAPISWDAPLAIEFLEEAAKWLGIVCWFSYIAIVSLAAVRGQMVESD